MGEKQKVSKAAAKSAADKKSKAAHARYDKAQKAEQKAFDKLQHGGDVLVRAAHADAMDEFRAARKDVAEAAAAVQDAEAMPEDAA